mgnify:CR=1 FL=1
MDSGYSGSGDMRTDFTLTSNEIHELITDYNTRNNKNKITVVGFTKTIWLQWIETWNKEYTAIIWLSRTHRLGTHSEETSRWLYASISQSACSFRQGQRHSTTHSVKTLGLNVTRTPLKPQLLYPRPQLQGSM